MKLDNSQDLSDVAANLKHWNSVQLHPVSQQSIPECLGTVQNLENEPIAVVGYSFRLPGASDPDTFWLNMKNQVNSMIHPPPGRWSPEQGIHPGKIRAEHFSRTKAGFLAPELVGNFDSSFFSISPAELEYTDPQARLLLLLSYEALEAGGTPTSSVRGTELGLFFGLWRDEYKDILPQKGGQELRRYLGTSFGNAAARVAHFLGTTGPSFTVETGCSSSICAIGDAISALRAGKVELALAGGANVLLKPFVYEDFQGVLSPIGECKPFQSDADGFSRAEGAAVFMLKKLSTAVKDGDKIHCLVKGFASSQEGLSRSVGTPTVEGELRAMNGALVDAGIKAEEVAWVEMHGTGTKVTAMTSKLQFNY